jgi:hypothetical protein
VNFPLILKWRINNKNGSIKLLPVFFALGLIHLSSGIGFSQAITSSSGLVTPLTALGASARADALGSAFTGVADDSSALFFNSAGLSGLDHTQVSLNHNSYLVSSFEETLLVGLPAGDLGGFAAAVQYVYWGNLDERDPLGVPLGTFADSDIALSLGWGREWAKDFSMGIAIHGIQQKIVDSQYISLSGDVGLLWVPEKDFRLGLVYAGLGTAVGGQSLATDLKGGLSYLFHLGQDDTLLSAFSIDYEPSGVSRLRWGIEAGYKKSFFLRAGYDLPLSDNQITGFSGFTAGAGVNIGLLGLDYAYIPYGNLGTSNRISLVYDFPNPTPVPVQPVTVVVTPVPAPTIALSPEPSGPTVGVHFVIPSISLTPNASVGNFALEEKYEKQTEANPNDAAAWHNLGLAYWNAGKTALAIQCFEQALRLDPSDMELNIWMNRYLANHPQNP